MKGTKRSSLVAPKKLNRKKTRLVGSIVTYLKSDAYFFAPLFSKSPPFTTQIQSHPPSNSDSSKADDISMAGFESLGIERVLKKKRRISEKVKEYLKYDFYMYRPMISPPKLGSSLKGESFFYPKHLLNVIDYLRFCTGLKIAFEAEKLQITNLVTMEVSTSSATIRKDNNYRSLRSEDGEQTLTNGRINSPKRALVILEGQRTGLSCETDISPSFSSLPEDKMVKPDQRRVTIK